MLSQLSIIFPGLKSLGLFEAISFASFPLKSVFRFPGLKSLGLFEADGCVYFGLGLLTYFPG